MAIAFVQGVSSTGTAGTSPQAAPAFGSSIAVGDLIVVLAGGDGGVTGLATSVSDTYGNTYTRVPSFDFANAGGTLNLDCFYARVTTGGANNVVTLTFNDGGENCVLVVQHFNGFTGTATYDQKSTSSNASSTTCTSGASPTTTQATELVVGLGIHASTTSAFSLGSGYTNLTQASVANRQAAMESKVVSSTGAQTATFTIAAARVNMGGVVTFYDAASGSNFSQTPSDSVTTSEAAVKNVVLNKSDTATATEAAAKNVALAKSDTATASEAKSLKPTLNKSDSVSASDSVTVTRGLVINVADRVAVLEIEDSDNFNDNVLNTAYWNDQSLGQGSETGGKYQFVIPAASTSYYGIESYKLYDLTANAVVTQLVSVGGATLGSCVLYAAIDGNNKVFFSADAGNLAAYEVVSGSQNFLQSTTYNSAAMQYLQIRASGGVTYWEYSADGDNWVELYHKNSPISMSAVHVAIQAGSYDSGQTGFTAVFDNFYVTGNAVVKNVGLGKSDAPTATDASMRAVGKNLSDSATASEAAAKNIGKAAADSVSTNDNMVASIIIQILIDDLVTASDASRRNVGKGISDTATGSDSVVKSFGKATADTVTVSDAATTAAGYVLSFSDSVTSNDAVARNVAKALTDSVNAGDVPMPGDIVHIEFDDTVTVTDAVTISLRKPQVVPGIPDGLTATDLTGYLTTEEGSAALGGNDINGILS